MRQKLKQGLGILVSLSLAFGPVPASALAQAEEMVVASSGATITEQPSTADRAAENSVFNELKKAYANAKAAADAAGDALAQKEQGYRTAQGTYDSVQSEVTQEEERLRGARNAAQDARDEAVADLSQKEDDKASADAAVSQNVAQTTSLEQSLQQAQSDVAAKQQAFNAASSAAATAQAEYDQATEDVSTAQQAVDAKVVEAEVQAAEGSFGFFQSVGATDAIDALQNCTYKDKIKRGEEVDATSLNNMKATLQWIRELNTIRASVGLSALKVSDLLMAYAQANADYSDTVIGHSGQFTNLSLTGNMYGENAAWNWGSNPFEQWYDQEKVYFDAAYQSITGSTTVPTGAAAFSWYNSGSNASQVKTYVTQTYGSSKSVGHYINDINPNFSTCGFGICTRRTQYPYTYVQYFGGNIASYTVDEYEQRFMSYYDSVRGDGVAAAEKQNLANAQTAQAAKQAALDEANATLATAQQELAAANTNVSSLQDQLATLQAQKTTLEAAADSAAQALAQARTNKDDKQDAYNQAQLDLVSYTDSAHLALEAAETARDNALAERDEAQRAKRAADEALAQAAKAFGLTDNNALVYGIEDVTYDGTEHTQDAAKLYVTMSSSGRSETYELARGVDYRVSCLNNKNAGTATITFRGAGDFTGGTTATFSISRAVITGLSPIASVTYTGSALRPKLVVRAGSFVLGTNDYTAAFANNTNAGKASVTVTGKGNFQGSLRSEFAIVRAKVSANPKATNRTYNGKKQTGVDKGSYYTLSGTTSATNAGTYVATATLDANHCWTDGSTAAKRITWSIAKAASTISLAAQQKTYTGQSVAYSGTVKRSGSKGKLTYTYYKDKACKTAVAAANVKAAGTYYVKGTLAADANHKAATSAAAKLTINKAANPLVATAVARSTKYTAVKPKTVTVARPLSVTKYKGKLSFAKVAKGSSSALTINASTGKVQVKKGTKKGTYKIKVKVTAAGGSNYKAGSKTVTCTVTVK